MEWKLVDKSVTTTPKNGTYRDWKSALAKEASYNCVYCCIHESKFGGQRNFHVEHFRPKSTFPQFENSYGNLFYACGICNSFKGNDWPAEPISGNLTIIAYPDPSELDYGNLLQTDVLTGLVVSRFPAGKYIIEKLYLNRPQMVTLRRFTYSLNEMTEAKDILYALKKAGRIPPDKMGQVMDFLFKLTDLWEKFSSVRPYDASQVRRTT
jgi:hypothetical protein